MNKYFKNIISITLITLISGLLLGIVYQVTKDPIATAKINATNKAYKKVLSDADTFEEYSDFDFNIAQSYLNDNSLSSDNIKNVVVGKSNNEKIGYVITVLSKEGFGGDIEFSVGILNDGTIKGIEILSISETAGLGMKAKEDEFKNQFKDINSSKIEYTKDVATQDNQVQAISGATVTTNAMVDGVNAAICYFENELKEVK